MEAERSAFLQRVAELEAHNRLLTEAAIERERRLQELGCELTEARIEIATIGPENARLGAERDFLASRMAELKAHNRMVRPIRTALQREEHPDPLLIIRRQLGYVIRRLIIAKHNPIDVVYIGGNIAQHSPPPPPGARVLYVVDPSEAGEGCDSNVGIPDPEREGSTLVIYATIDFLSRWTRLEEDLDRCLDTRRGQIIIVLIVPGFRPLEFATHSYLLSILASSFPTWKFMTRLEVYDTPELPGPVAKRPLLQSMRLLTGDVWRMLKRNWLLISGGGNEPPARFSALVISVEPPGRAPRQAAMPTPSS